MSIRARRRVPALTFGLVLAVSVASCKGSSTTEFPAGVAPLEEDTTPAPAATADDPHPESLNTVNGATSEYSYTRARGYVHASLATTWAAMRNADACVDRRKVDTWMVSQGVEQGYLYSYRIHNIVHSSITVEYDTTWRQDVAAGTADAPEVVGARYQKTDGTDYITLMEGSVVARRVDDSTTEVEIIEHLNAFGQDMVTTESTVRDYYGSIVALAHGQPLPTYQ